MTRLFLVLALFALSGVAGAAEKADRPPLVGATGSVWIDGYRYVLDLSYLNIPRGEIVGTLGPCMAGPAYEAECAEYPSGKHPSVDFEKHKLLLADEHRREPERYNREVIWQVFSKIILRKIHEDERASDLRKKEIDAAISRDRSLRPHDDPVRTRTIYVPRTEAPSSSFGSVFRTPPPVAPSIEPSLPRNTNCTVLPGSPTMYCTSW